MSYLHVGFTAKYIFFLSSSFYPLFSISFSLNLTSFLSFISSLSPWSALRSQPLDLGALHHA